MNMAKEPIFTDKAPAPQGAYSQAIKSGGFVFVSGQIPIDMSTGIITAEGIHKETRIIMDNMKEIKFSKHCLNPKPIKKMDKYSQEHFDTAIAVYNEKVKDLILINYAKQELIKIGIGKHLNI